MYATGDYVLFCRYKHCSCAVFTVLKFKYICCSLSLIFSLLALTLTSVINSHRLESVYNILHVDLFARILFRFSFFFLSFCISVRSIRRNEPSLICFLYIFVAVLFSVYFCWKSFSFSFFFFSSNVIFHDFILFHLHAKRFFFEIPRKLPFSTSILFLHWRTSQIFQWRDDCLTHFSTFLFHGVSRLFHFSNRNEFPFSSDFLFLPFYIKFISIFFSSSLYF